MQGGQPRAIQADEVPALLGIDPDKGRWTLWKEHRGELPQAKVGMVPPLGEAQKPALVKWLMDYGQVGIQVRGPKGVVRSPVLALEAQPDLVAPGPCGYGEGPGFILVEWLTQAEWAKDWHAGRSEPVVPETVRAKGQAMFMVLGTRWGLVVPQIGVEPAQRGLLLRDDPELRDKIGMELWKFQESLRSGIEPAPDARADRECLRALARLCPRPGVREEVRLEGAQLEQAQAAVQDALVRQERYEQLKAGTETARQEYADAMARVIAATGGEGSTEGIVQVGGYRIRGRTRARMPKAVEPPEVAMIIETAEGEEARKLVVQ